MQRYIIIALFLQCFNSFAMPAPAYLSVYGWQKCTNVKKIENMQIVCLPRKRPNKCQRSSWNELKQNEGMLGYLAFCNKK